MHWTPDTVNQLLSQIAGIIGAIVIIVQLVKGNATSVPQETVHKVIDALNNQPDLQLQSQTNPKQEGINKVG